jgi:hypothetical protein
MYLEPIMGTNRANTMSWKTMSWKKMSWKTIWARKYL